MEIVQFDTSILNPTEGQVISIPTTGQMGPPATGSVIFRARWICSEQPTAMNLTWRFYFNGEQCGMDIVPVVWTGNDGAVTASPSTTICYLSRDEGANSYKLTASCGGYDREASVNFTIEVRTPSSSSAPSSSAAPSSSSSPSPSSSASA